MPFIIPHSITKRKKYLSIQTFVFLQFSLKEILHHLYILMIAVFTFFLLARKTTHRQLHGGKNPPKGYRLSFWLGDFCNKIALWLNKTIYKKHPLKRDYILRFAEKERVIKDANKIIVASVSFSLLMFGIGMIITVIYLFMAV